MKSYNLFFVCEIAPADVIVDAITEYCYRKGIQSNIFAKAVSLLPLQSASTDRWGEAGSIHHKFSHTM